MAHLLERTLLAIARPEISFEKLGFAACDPEVRAHLEEVMRVFVRGFELAIENDDYSDLSRSLDDAFDDHHVGFAYEGAGMYFGLKDLSTPGRRSRLEEFTREVSHHGYIVNVGAGFAVSRIPWGLSSLRRYMKRLDPMTAWCVPDGYGFHQGMFHFSDYVDGCREPPRRFPSHLRQLFDSGVGRSIWWVKGANPERIQKTIDRFPFERREELWCGIGVAASYAGTTDSGTLLQLLELSGPHRRDYLSGPLFAARMREKGGNPCSWTDAACELLLGMTGREASDLLLHTFNGIQTEWNESGGGPLEEGWKLGYQMVRAELKKFFLTRQPSARFARLTEEAH